MEILWVFVYVAAFFVGIVAGVNAYSASQKGKFWPIIWAFILLLIIGYFATVDNYWIWWVGVVLALVTLLKCWTSYWKEKPHHE